MTICRTKPSELPPAQAQKAPERLEQKTRSLEKRLLLRHFITKALEIRRAEVAAEEERRSQAMKEFIRLPPVPPPIQPLIRPEDQPKTPNVFSVVEQARPKAVAEQEDKLEDLLSNDIEDLIDFSNDSPALPSLAPTNCIHGFKELDGLRGLLMSQQTSPDTTDKADSEVPNQHAVSDNISEHKYLQSSQFVSQPQTPDLSMLDVDAQRHRVEEISKPKYPDPSQVALQFPTPGLSMADSDTQNMVKEQVVDTSPTTNFTPSILSHTSTMSSASGSSVPGITEAELRERDSKMQNLPKLSSYGASPPQPVRRKAVRSHSSESPAQCGLGRPNMTLSPVSSPIIQKVAECNPPAISRASTGEVTAPMELEVSARSKSEDVIHQPDSTAEPSLQDINKLDGDGFPWIVQAARDGDETQIKRLIVSGADLEAVHATTKRSALCEASLQGHSNVVDLLIREGCMPDHVDADSYTALHHACRKGYLAATKSLIAANSDIEASGPQKQTPLHLAVQVPHRNVVMLLLQRKANVNARDENNQTPLHISAAQGKVEMCSYLLENGAQLDNRDSKSRTALQLACEAGHYETVETMLKRSNLRATDLTFLTAFFAAVEHGHIRIAESFLSRELDLQKLSKNDIYKPATLAAKNGSLAMLELMIRNNCSIKAKDDNDWNALHFAAQYGHWQLVEPLVANDVSVKAATRMKDTPLILAVKGGHFTATEILLRSKGISVTVEDGQAQQPIHHATRVGSLEIFDLLISNGAKIAVENAFGWHPIHIAVAYGHTRLVDGLIERFANVEEKLGSSSIKKEQTHRMVEDGCWAEARWPYPGSRPLHLACEYGHYQIASNLISKGAKLEASCSEGWRPLHHAAFDGSSALVEFLLNAGCYPWAETEEGNTPQTLQFRTAGTPIPQEEKDRVRLLLQEAMDRTSKKPEGKGFKVGLKKGRTVGEKQNLIRAANCSIELAAKSPKQGTQNHRPHHSHPPMLHSNTFPSAVPKVHHPDQTVQPSRSSLSERPISSASTRPSLTTSESNLKAATNITSSRKISNLFTGPRELELEETTSNTALIPRSANTIALQHSMDPVQGLPSLPLNLMKNKLKLKRASTFGVDMSKQGIEKMSSGLGSSRQGLEKISNYSLDVSKQGYKKMSSYGQNMSKQGLEKVKKINYGQHMSKQGMEKMKNIGIRREKKSAKQDTHDDNSGKTRPLQLSSDIITSAKDSTSTTQNTSDPLQSSNGLQTVGQNAGENKDAVGDTTSQNSQSDEDLPYNSDGAESVGAFSMGGFDTFGDGGNDGGDFDGDGC